MALTKITTSLVAVNTLTAANIADNTIDATKIAQNQILARHIAAGALSDQLAANSITAAMIPNATALTLDGGVTVDEITIDADTITATDDFIIDATTNIFLDADGGEVVLRDGGSNFGYFHQDSNNFEILSTRSDGDIIIKGNDDGTPITALTLDMSDAGTATFNHDIRLGDNGQVILGAGSDFSMYHDGSNTIMNEAGTGGLRISSSAVRMDLNSDTDYSSTGEPAGILTLYNSNGSDGAGVNNYSSLEFNTGDGATSQGFINYVRTADNQGKFTFSQRTGSSTYKEAMSIHNDGTMHVGFNEDQQSIFGRTWIGFVSGLSDYAGIGHIDVADSGGYALLQSSGGATFLNAEDGADIYFLNHGTTSMRLSSTGRLGLGVDPADGQTCQYGIQIKGGNDNYQATNFNESCQLSISTEVNTEGRYAAIRFTHIGNTEGFFGLVRRSATSDITDFVWQMYNGSTNTYQEHARLSSSALLTAAGKDNGAGGGTYGYMTCSTNLSGYTAGDYPTLKTDGNTIHFDANGTYTGYISHNTSFTDISDEREKDTIETISGATALVKQLRGVTHKWKDRRDDKTHYGLIAQEVEKVVPDVVSEGATKVGETEPTKGVAYQKLVPLLIETIKELEARITTLES